MEVVLRKKVIVQLLQNATVQTYAYVLMVHVYLKVNHVH